MKPSLPAGFDPYGGMQKQDAALRVTVLVFLDLLSYTFYKIAWKSN